MKLSQVISPSNKVADCMSEESTLDQGIASTT